MKKIFQCFILCFIFSLNCFAGTSTFRIIDNSILNVKGHENSIAIKTNYDFFWNRFIDPNDYSSTPDLVVYVPSVWKKYDLSSFTEEKFNTSQGAASYRILITNLKPNTEYSFSTYGMTYTAVNIYCNGDLFFSSGIPNEDFNKTVADQKMSIATFKSDSAGNALLIFHISNYFYRKGGFRNAIQIQEHKAFINTFYTNLHEYSLLSGILLIIILYSLLLAFLNKNKTNLYLALFVLSILLRILSQGFPMIKYFFPNFPYTLLLRIEYTSVFLAPALYSLYIYSMNPDLFRHFNIKYLVSPGLILLLLDFVTPIYITNRLVPVMQIYLLIIVLFDLTVLLINSIKHKNFISNIAILTLIIIGLGTISDIFVLNYISIFNGKSWLTISFVIYAIAQTVLVAYLQNRNMEQLQHLKNSLQETNKAYYRFVPREFLDLFNKKDITEVQLGEYKSSQMAILSADIRNFTSISEKMSEIQVFDMLNSYLKKIAPVIREHNGIIEKYLGDGIIAIFPDSAESALKCAIKMQEEMNTLRKEFRERNLPEIKIGIGIHYGNIIIGTGGDNDRMTEISLSNDIDLAVKTEAATKVLLRPILVTKQVLSIAAEEARNENRTFNFYGKKASPKQNSDLYYIYSDITGEDL